QLREVVERLMAAGQWRAGDADILIVADAGYDGPRLAWLLRDLPVQILARMRSDRVLRRATPARVAGTNGRPPRHGGEFIFGDRSSWGEPEVATATGTRLYGQATAWAWDRLHPRLTRRAAWIDSAELPVIEGTVIRLEVDHLPSGAIPKPVWLWWSGVDAAAAEVDRMWQAFLRRFDIEHTFRLLKQTLGWACPKIRAPQAADRWTWPILADPGRLYPAPAGPAVGRRPTPPLGGARTPAAPVARPCPPGVSAPARDDTHSRSSAETLPIRTRTATRSAQQPARTTPRRLHRHRTDQREDQHNEAKNQEIH
ncbi:transposase, partial [Streptosporangium sp. NPDC000396]|uniref:transposase n=1 Tax=Streptosporangium sp. NPDC000396 TaxID=3366185 RepID=UPI00368A0FD5